MLSFLFCSMLWCLFGFLLNLFIVFTSDKKVTVRDLFYSVLLSIFWPFIVIIILSTALSFFGDIVIYGKDKDKDNEQVF